MATVLPTLQSRHRVGRHYPVSLMGNSGPAKFISFFGPFTKNDPKNVLNTGHTPRIGSVWDGYFGYLVGSLSLDSLRSPVTKEHVLRRSHRGASQ